MQPDDIQKLIESKIQDAKVTVSGDGRHFEAIVISSSFEGMNLVARQRAVFNTLGDNIRSGAIHALSIKAKTPQEWQLENHKNHG